MSSFQLSFGGSLGKYKTLGTQWLQRAIDRQRGDDASLALAYLKGSAADRDRLRDQLPTAEFVWPAEWLDQERFGGLNVDQYRVVIFRSGDDAVVFCLADPNGSGETPWVFVCLGDEKWKRVMPHLGNHGEVAWRRDNGVFLIEGGKEIKRKLEAVPEASAADSAGHGLLDPT